MDAIEAGQILRQMYDQAPKGEMVTQIHLFGVKYARELETLSLKDVVGQARISVTYVSEVNKGKNLAKYVTVKDNE